MECTNASLKVKRLILPYLTQHRSDKAIQPGVILVIVPTNISERESYASTRILYFPIPLQLKGTCLPQENWCCPAFSRFIWLGLHR